MERLPLFERATLAQIRFDSPRGELTTEQLWQLPLTSNRSTEPNLDALARGIAAELREVEGGSFVNVHKAPRETILTLKLDVLKRVIEVQQTKNKEAEKRLSDKQLLERLKAAKAAAEDRQLEGMSAEELDAKIAELQPTLGD